MFNDETIFLPPQALSERRQKQETANRGKKNVVVVELTVERIFQIMWTRCFSVNWTKAVSLIKGSKSSYRSQLKSLFGSSEKKRKRKKNRQICETTFMSRLSQIRLKVLLNDDDTRWRIIFSISAPQQRWSRHQPTVTCLLAFHRLNLKTLVLISSLNFNMLGSMISLDCSIQLKRFSLRNFVILSWRTRN